MSTSSVPLTRESGADGRPGAYRLTVAPADHDLTVIIPAYNEEKRLPWTLAQLATFLDRVGRGLSRTGGRRRQHGPDGRADARFGAAVFDVAVDPQGGKGRAVRTAMLRATGRVLCFTDADLPFRLTALRQGYEWIRGGACEVVFGARDIEGSENLAPRRLWRRLATFAFREVVRRLVSREVTDTQCGLKLFSRRAALEIFARGTIDGFAFDAEVVMLTHRLGLPFRRVPVTLVNEFASTLSLRRNALPMLLDVLRLRWRDRMGRGAPAPQFIFTAAEGRTEGRGVKAMSHMGSPCPRLPWACGANRLTCPRQAWAWHPTPPAKPGWILHLPASYFTPTTWG